MVEQALIFFCRCRRNFWKTPKKSVIISIRPSEPNIAKLEEFMEQDMEKREGFTLIELLVVIAIIAMLLAILLPSLNKVKEKAREVICRVHQRGIGLGLIIYIDENDGKVYPTLTNKYMWYDANGNWLSPTDSDAYWGVAYKDTIDNPKVFGCPSFQRPIDSLYSDMPPELLKEAAFAINSDITYFDKVAEIKSPSFFIVCHDHQEPKIENGSNDHFHNDGPGTMNVRQYREGGSRDRFYRNLFRHSTRSGDDWKTGGKANILWLDGHVSSLAETTGDDVPRRWYEGR